MIETLGHFIFYINVLLDYIYWCIIVFMWLVSMELFWLLYVFHLVGSLWNVPLGSIKLFLITHQPTLYISVTTTLYFSYI